MPDLELQFPKLYDRQRAFVEDAARYTICFASTKSGKSVGMLVWLLGRAWQLGRPGRDFHWIAPSFGVAKVMFLRMSRWLRRADPDQAVWSTSETELFISLGNGARIYFKGGDRPDMLYGPDSWGVVIDEGTRLREEVWHAARSLVTKTEAPIKIVGNARSRADWMYKLYLRAQAGETGMAAHHINAYDAVAGGVLRIEEIEDAKRQLPDVVFRALYLAEPGDAEAHNPFGLAAITSCIQPVSSKRVAVWGIDLGKSQDWTVIVGLDAEGIVAGWDRFQKPWPETIQTLTQVIRGTPTLVDSTGLGDPILEQLQRESGSQVEGFKFTQPSKQQLMEGLAVAIQQQQIGFPDGQIVRELESFEYIFTRLGVRYGAIEGAHDDCVCALALAVRHLFGGVHYQPAMMWGGIGV